MFGKKKIETTAVLQALSTVQDPDLKKDLVTLGMIQNLRIEGDKVDFDLVLTTPACPVKEQLKSACEEAVKGVKGIREVSVRLSAKVPGVRKKGLETVGAVIAVSSGKGGVGKSTVAVNLAVSLSQMGAKVGLLDTDFYGPNVPTMMGVGSLPELDGDQFTTPERYGVKIMSMGFLVPPGQPVVWRGPMLHSMLEQFCTKVHWGTLDYLVVDMPPGTGDVQLSLAQIVPLAGAVLVTTPQEVSLQDVRKAYAMFQKVRVPVLGVVENMSHFVCGGCSATHYPFGQDGGRMLAQMFQVPLLASLPLQPEVRQGGDDGMPVASRPGVMQDLYFKMAEDVVRQVSIQLVGQSGAQPRTQAGAPVEIGAF